MDMHLYSVGIDDSHVAWYLEGGRGYLFEKEASWN